MKSLVKVIRFVLLLQKLQQNTITTKASQFGLCEARKLFHFVKHPGEPRKRED